MKTTAAGKFLLFLSIWVLLAALITVNNFLFIVFTMMIGLMGVSHVLAKRNIRAVALSRRFPRELYAQTPFPISYQLHATKSPWGAFSLTFREPVPLEAKDEVTTRAVPPGEPVIQTAVFTLPRRGDYEIGPGTLLSAFPFGFATYSRPYGQPQTVLVFPRIESLQDEIPYWVGVAGGGSDRKDPLGTTPYLFRHYAEGDPYKLIDWKKSAGTGRLITRVLAEPSATDIVIRLPADAKEDAISKAASLIVHFSSQGRPVTLLGPGVRIGPGHHQDFAMTCLAALARWERVAGAADIPECPAAITVDVDASGYLTWTREH